ncbi:MAG: methylmalonyl Co-A mutase-associated GTPase MeaB [Candidatus Latescibacterota bacterium]
MTEDYYKQFFAGETLAASRLMTLVEKGGRQAEETLDRIFPKVGRSYRVGITGLTGAGKSTLISGLIALYRKKNLTVGVIAEDPTSPFSGGAILGDRIRMQDNAGDDGVFIRSIASRGSETGLSACATELADIMDAFGRDMILLETIGVGQLEYKIRFSAYTTVVVLTPDAGDDVQGLKSGIMEIGEIFVVNKADRPNSERFAEDLRSTLELRYNGKQWIPSVLSCVATRAEGIDAVVDAIEAHRTFLEQNGGLEKKRIEGLTNRINMVVEEKLKEFFWRNEHISEQFAKIFDDVKSGSKSPYQAARELMSPLRIETDKGRSK